MCRYLVYVGIYFMCQKMFEKQQKENSKECWGLHATLLDTVENFVVSWAFFQYLGMNVKQTVSTKAFVQ